MKTFRLLIVRVNDRAADISNATGVQPPVRFLISRPREMLTGLWVLTMLSFQSSHEEVLRA